MKRITILVLSVLLFAIGISAFSQSNLADTSVLYFHTVLLVHKQLGDYWRNDSAYMSWIGEMIGHHPDSCEIDSMINIRLHESALHSNSLYSSFLQKLNEPVLCNGYSTTVYRQTWFQNELKDNYSPYSIRIEEDKNGGHTAYFSYCVWDWRWRDSSIHHDTIAIDKNKWEEFVLLMNEYDFLDKPSTLDTSIVVFGGSTCILESWEKGKYHAVFRNVSIDPTICEMQLYMWQMIGMKRKMPGSKPGLLSRFIMHTLHLNVR